MYNYKRRPYNQRNRLPRWWSPWGRCPGGGQMSVSRGDWWRRRRLVYGWLRPRRRPHASVAPDNRPGVRRPPRPAPRRTAPLDWKKRASTSRFQQQPSHRPASAPLISLAAWTTCSQRMNWSELNWTELTHSYTTRSLVTRVSVTPWLAAAKLGRLVLGEFWTDAFQCGYSHWSLRTGGQFSL